MCSFSFLSYCARDMVHYNVKSVLQSLSRFACADIYFPSLPYKAARSNTSLPGWDFSPLQSTSKWFIRGSRVSSQELSAKTPARNRIGLLHLIFSHRTFTRLNLLKHQLTVFSFFQSLSMWRRSEAEPLTPLCPQRQSTTFARSEWRRNWSEHARALARRRLCRHRTTREIQCLFCRKYTGMCQTRTNSKIDLKQYPNAMSQKYPHFPLEFSFLKFSES